MREEGIEHLFAINVAANDIQVINTRADTKGFLELQALEGGPLYLFPGTVAKADALAQIKKGFLIGAAVGQAARCKTSSELGNVTVFAKVESMGFLKTVEYPGC